MIFLMAVFAGFMGGEGGRHLLPYIAGKRQCFISGNFAVPTLQQSVPSIKKTAGPVYRVRRMVRLNRTRMA